MSAHPPPNAAELRQVMFGLGLAMLLSALDQTIVVTAMPTIAVDLGDPQDLPWIVTAYLIAATVVTPLYGKFADVYGRRIVILVGVATFMIGSVACALAPSMAALAGARVIQGLGGGGLISLGQTIVADLVSPRERGRYQSYFAAVFITSSIAGPALGGFFAQYWHWSLIFWINLPLGLAAFIIVNARLKRLPEQRHPHSVDYLGAILLIAASGVLVLALGWGGVRYPWRSAPIVGLLAVSTLAWALFAWRTARAEEPLIPLRILGLAIVRDAIFSSAFGIGAFVGLSVVMPIYFEICSGMNASDSGLTLIPLMVGTVAGATLSGWLMAHVTHYKAPPLLGLGAGFLAALGAAAMMGTGRSLLLLNALLTVTTFGIGAMLPVATVSVQNVVDTRDLGTATASMQFFRQLAAGAIVALFAALAIGGGRAQLLEQLKTDADGAALFSSFRLVFLALAVCLGLSFIFLARMEERPLRGERRA
ncbi:MFS transporter [Methylocystis sp. B8]|uniref:MFS transporter n=1 Tax=Methylocystis sp. B8 TaxID=544938 RepID=UPI0010FEC04F|nr:MFS transporter [Methylocystis sp. B8]TLG76890.1 MFS transporter [Methylocystis sp. B8]